MRCAAAGVYTTNKVCGAPIKVDRAHLTDGYAQAIVVNSGNANTCAANGVALAEECCELVGKALNIDAKDVLPASTGVIGQPMVIDPFARGIPAAAAKLAAFRAEQPDFLDLSFDTIAGYGPHGAIVHYDPTPETDVPLKAQGLLLVDSGGHYARGTTDVTRTIALGPITDEERRRSTQVLQGHIQLAMAEFPQGVMGENLDALARGPLWREGLDYDHGTGHGVGCVLSVHEAPPSFRWRIAEGLAHPALETGMVISDEPGYYAAGRFGIRHENLLLVQPAEAAGFLRFETLTLAPFDRDALDPALLTASERDWLNGYHRRVYAQIAPLVPTEVRQWLREVTAAL